MSVGSAPPRAAAGRVFLLGVGSVVVVTAILLLVGAESTPLLDPDESRFARTSLEMLRSGDRVVPHFEGRPRLVKPPLLHWIQSALFHVFGLSNSMARLPSVLASLGSILLVAWIGRRRFGDEGAVWAAACMATMPLVLAHGRLGTLDAILALHVLAVIALDVAAPTSGGGYRALGIGGLLGLAFLVKGPVGVALPLVIMLAGRTATGREVLPTLNVVLLFGAGWSVVVLPWGLTFLRRVGSGSVSSTLRDEAFGRFFAGTTHVEPPWYYLAVVAVAFLPWLPLLGMALVRLFRLRHDPSVRTALYAAAGFAAGLVFFSLSQSKIPNYVLPLAPLAALLIAWEIERERSEPDRRAGPGMLAATLALLAVGLGAVAGHLDAGGPQRTAVLGSVVYGAGTLAAVPGLLRRRPRGVFASAAISASAFFLVVVTVLLPHLARTRSAAYLVETVPELSSGRPVVVVDMKVPSLTLYLDRVPEQVDGFRFEKRLDRDDSPLIVFDRADLPRIPAPTERRLSKVAEAGKYVVYEKVVAVIPSPPE